MFVPGNQIEQQHLLNLSLMGNMCYQHYGGFLLFIPKHEWSTRTEAMRLYVSGKGFNCKTDPAYFYGLIIPYRVILLLLWLNY